MFILRSLSQLASKSISRRVGIFVMLLFSFLLAGGTFAISFENDFILPLFGDKVDQGIGDAVGEGSEFLGDVIGGGIGNQIGDQDVGNQIGDQIGDAINGAIGTDSGDGGSYVYDFDRLIDPDKPLLDSLKDIFYPPVFGDESVSGGKIRQLIRTIGVGLLTLALIRTGAKLIFKPNDEEARKGAFTSLLYIGLGILLFFGATWILDSLLNIGEIDGLLGGGGSELDGVVDKLENTIFFQVIAFLKAFAFFLAIGLTTWYGFQFMTAMSEEEKLTKAKKGLLNVLLALVFIKVIDYIYFIAHTGEFKEVGLSAFSTVVTGLSFVFGAAIFLLILYIGFLYITSAGDDERISSATKYLKNLVVTMLVVFMFFLVVSQIFGDLI